MMQNLSRGEAIIKYLEIIQSLPMFAMHYFEVKVCVGWFVGWLSPELNLTCSGYTTVITWRHSTTS